MNPIVEHYHLHIFTFFVFPAKTISRRAKPAQPAHFNIRKSLPKNSRYCQAQSRETFRTSSRTLCTLPYQITIPPTTKRVYLFITRRVYYPISTTTILFIFFQRKYKHWRFYNNDLPLFTAGDSITIDSTRVRFFFFFFFIKEKGYSTDREKELIANNLLSLSVIASIPSF